MPIATINPATGKTEQTFDALTDAQIETAMSKADKAAGTLRDASLQTRSDWLSAAAKILRDEKEELGALMTREMGKPLKQAIAEAEKCALVCEYYAEHGERLLTDKHIKTKSEASFVRYLPLGPVLAVMPWNYPFWQVFRFAAPAIMVGNPGLLKHASNVPQCSLKIADVFARAGVPEGGFQSLLVGSDAVEGLLKDNRLKAATVTGSEGAGRAVAETAGGALKPVVLELGGSDPFIVLPSADMDKAIDLAIQGRTQNNGQSCIAAKRFIAHADIYHDFRDRFAARLDALKVGDPMKEGTEIGPLATVDIRNELSEQVEDSIRAGARCVIGAEEYDGQSGWYYKPGLLEQIPQDAPAAKEELFGPVASLFKAKDFDDAINIANNTRFGLGSAIMTNDKAEMQEAFSRLNAGATFINTITASDPRLPFGGIGDSGFGRELAEEGLKAFTNAKTCAIGSPSG